MASKMLGMENLHFVSDANEEYVKELANEGDFYPIFIRFQLFDDVDALITIKEMDESICKSTIHVVDKKILMETLLQCVIHLFRYTRDTIWENEDKIKPFVIILNKQDFVSEAECTEVASAINHAAIITNTQINSIMVNIGTNNSFHYQKNYKSRQSEMIVSDCYMLHSEKPKKNKKKEKEDILEETMEE